METVRYPSETAHPKAKAKAKAKAAPRAASASTVRYPSQEPGVLLPTEEEAERTGVRLSKAKKKVTTPAWAELRELRALALAEKVGKEEKDEKPKPVAKAKGQPRKVPSAGSQGGKKPVIRKVRITAGPPEAMGVLKWGRGRPKGAVGKAKRDSALKAGA